MKYIRNVFVLSFDLVLLLVSLLGIDTYGDYYIPWGAISRDGDNIYVRSGPDKDYAHIRKLSGDEPVLIVGEVYDWYVLSRDTLEMVRQDLMKSNDDSSYNQFDFRFDYMKTNPPWHLIAILLLWFWPRIRSWLWKNFSEQAHSAGESVADSAHQS